MSILVILENITRFKEVDKLKDILLVEKDFNV